jgi:hypothetical protein
MKQTKQTILIVGLAFVLVAAFSGCTRDKVGLPGPTGPSTVATILKLSASPNVIAAGLTQRQEVTITANLYKFDGQPVSGVTIHFEIRDQLGRRVYVGLMDGSQNVLSKATDSSGRVTVNYRGPLVDELENLDYLPLYIYAHVGWQGKEEITELCPLNIISDVFDIESELQFDLQAFPNVLWCGSTPPTSRIVGKFIYKINGIPVVGRKVYFKIIRGPGKFDDGFAKTFAVTDDNGVAEVTYIGPTRNELTADTEVEIQGQPETDWIQVYTDPYDPAPIGEEDKYYIHKEMIIRLIKGTGVN